ncbi:hypothetical protein [Nonomuraea glycinis]|uniref:hypothetical protein n=1 Tax=Nonomuraea glycinis TaxID=2047744 RepID=UPI002E120AD3|nr:hypothetical protein OHA68_02010 [Nonomuraea glycinis]
MSERPEAELVAKAVDTHEWGATESDEEQVLVSLGYVLNPATGIYEEGPNGGSQPS